MTRLRAHDDAFVAVPPADVFDELSDADAYPAWWPGARSDDDGDLRLPLGRGSVHAHPSGHRREIGLWLELPAFDGSLQWYLTPHDDGTLVNAFLDVDLPGGPARGGRRLLRFRFSVRRALVGLKRSMERT